MLRTLRNLGAVCVAVIFLAAGSASTVDARTIVVDCNHPKASDSNDGASEAPLATIQKAADIAAPGDRVVVRPGRYPEGVLLKTSGTAEAPIVFAAEPARGALLDGADILAGWQRCTSAGQCAGNPNFKNIHTAMLPKGATLFTANLYEGEEILFISQDPPPRNPYVWDDREVLRPIQVDGYSSMQLIDKAYFTQTDPDYWVGATVIVWTANNAILPRTITGYWPGEGKIMFETTTRHLNIGKDRFGVMNHPALVRAAGQYAVGPAGPDGRRKVYLWPRDEKSLEGKITASARKVGFYIKGKSYVHIEGFRIRRYSGSRGDLRAGQGILNVHGQKTEGVVVRNNEVYQCRAGSGYWAINLADCNGALVEDNYVHHNPMNRGIGVTGSKSGGNLKNVIVRNNTVERAGGTGINFYFVSDGRIVGNKVLDSQSNHGNGITVYLFCKNILVSGNTVLRSNMGITVQESTNVTLTNNLLVGQEGQSRLLVMYGRGGGNMTVIGNTVLNSSTHSGISLPKDAKNYVVKNNLTDGIAVGKHEGVLLENNLYTGLTWNMKPGQIGAGGIIEKDLAKIFADAEKGNYRLKPGSPAIDAGVDTSSVVKTDIEGTPRPQGKAFDIGAYEAKP